MSFNDDVKRYLRLRKSGRLARFNSERRSLTRRRIIARFTCGRRLPSAVAGWCTRLTASPVQRARLAEIIRGHASPEQLRDSRWLRRIKRDVYYTEYHDRISADEYFRYGFEYLSPSGRHKYVGNAELSRLRKLGAPPLTNDKYESYLAFKPYYQREALLIRGREDLADLRAFCTRHPVFFFKPLSAAGGHGVQRVDASDMTDEEREDLLSGLIDRYCSAIAEQPIIQAEGMARFHPASINTIRVVSLKKDGKLEVIQTSVRLGTGESVVDNGCLSASVDTETGIITSPGRAAHEKGLYLRHPDTGVQILGSAIPQWPELLAQVEEQMGLFEGNCLIGWDMAYSVDGWVVVEVNSFPAIQTLAGNGVGVRDLFERILR
ncbi:MAG: hypothetical protein IK116_06100 [Firmicutes bacterium]|nr:hypothetical protein [Bacillota bacterium]